MKNRSKSLEKRGRHMSSLELVDGLQEHVTDRCCSDTAKMRTLDDGAGATGRTAELEAESSWARSRSAACGIADEDQRYVSWVRGSNEAYISV